MLHYQTALRYCPETWTVMLHYIEQEYFIYNNNSKILQDVLIAQFTAEQMNSQRPASAKISLNYAHKYSKLTQPS